MNRTAKIATLAAATLLLAGAAFWGGTVYQRSAASPGGAAGMVGADGTPAGRGPFADLSADEQAELEDMTDEERQAWLAQNMGDRAGMGGPARGGTLEGEVLEVADDTITLSLETGSQTIYTDENTVVAYTEDAVGLTTGATIMVVSEPTADGVTTASLVVVK
ncbi:MAG: hypothetical protein JW733_04775 [Coriobacteriia bacterium]|nr:hypothetical protein [Coriobacteriia bacterium]MBN2847421.1 hypothetical protein [Coriobacteriia bacterium]